MTQPFHPSSSSTQARGSGSHAIHAPGSGPGLNPRQTPNEAARQQVRGSDFHGVPIGPRQHLQPSRTYNHSTSRNTASRQSQGRTHQHNYHYNGSSQHDSQSANQQIRFAATLRPSPASYPRRQAWSSNTDAYSSMYNDESSVKRKTTLTSITRSGQAEASQGIKSRKYGYAFIGKEADQYIREDLREQLDYLSSIGGDGTANAPLEPSKIVFQFKKDGHQDTARKQLLSHFQSSEHKDYLLQTLQAYLLQRINSLDVAAREKMAAQEERLQLSELSRWIEDSLEPAKIVDDVLNRLRGDLDDEDSLFGRRGIVGRALNSHLSDTIQLEKRQSSRGDSSDEEGGDSTPFYKASTTSGGSQTPLTTAMEQS